MPAGSYEIRFVQYDAHPPNVLPDGGARFNDQWLSPPERLVKVPEGPTWWAAQPVTAVDQDVTVTVRLEPGVRVKGRAAIRPVEVTTSRDGRFRADGVAPGRYRFELIDAAGSRVLDSLWVHGRRQPTATIDIENAVNAEELELVIAPTTASLSGTVLGAEADPSSYVIALVPPG